MVHPGAFSEELMVTKPFEIAQRAVSSSERGYPASGIGAGTFRIRLAAW